MPRKLSRLTKPLSRWNSTPGIWFSSAVLMSRWFCPFVQRAWIALEEGKLPYQYKEVNPYKKEVCLEAPAELSHHTLLSILKDLFLYVFSFSHIVEFGR